MIDMKYEESEKKDFVMPKPESPKYPYGLKICLGPKELEKLGIQGVPQVGGEYKMLSKVEVVEVAKCDESGDESGFRVHLQIKELDLKKEGEEKEQQQSTTKVLYGE